jgi:hypothetical protein
VHPIERLRFVARASGAPQRLLVDETAAALRAFRHDPQGLVTACRRVVSRQPTSGVLLWFAARVLTAPDAMDELVAAAEAVDDDPTAVELGHALPEDATACILGWPDQVTDALVRRGDVSVLVVDVGGEATGLVSRLVRADVDAEEVPLRGLGSAVAAADLVLLEAAAIGPDAFLAVSGSRAAAATARHAGVPVWVVAGVGRILPARMWDGFAARAVPAAREPWEAEDEVVALDLVDRIVGPWGLRTVDDALARCDCPVAPELFRGDIF